MPAETSRAVFLSYASQDAEAARHICEALRAAGLEVWFDQSELRGGDVWDQQIRRQIRECALFVPIVSAATQARREGYFRLEWKLADDRTHLMAKGTPFLLPVCIDQTKDWDAIVPDSFMTVQWTRLPCGEPSAGFCERVATLLAGEQPATGKGLATENKGPNVAPAAMSVRSRVILIFSGVAAVLLLAAGGMAIKRWKDSGKAPPVSNAAAPTVTTPQVSEARQLVAKARRLFYQLDETKEDFKMAEDLLKQAIAKDSGDAEVWAAYAQLHQRYRARGWDMSDERREEARTATQRALRLDPQSYEARFAQTALTVGSAREAAERETAFRDLLRERPDDQRALRGLGSLLRNFPEKRDEAIRIYDQSAALPGGDPLALYNKALTLWFDGRATDAEGALRAALAQKPFVGARLMDAFFALTLRGDLERAKARLDQIPTAELLEDRGCFFAYTVHRYRGKPDAALATVRAFSREWIDDNWYRGPRARLAGEALLQAGRPEAAAIEWRTALKVTDARLAANPNELPALGNRLFLLACLALGERTEAIRQIGVALGDKVHVSYFTAADLRYDPTWAPLRGEPEFARLLAEAERVEKADDVATVSSSANAPATKAK